MSIFTTSPCPHHMIELLCASSSATWRVTMGVPDLCRAAFADPSGRTNPRMPLLSELHDLLAAGYRG